MRTSCTAVYTVPLLLAFANALALRTYRVPQAHIERRRRISSANAHIDRRRRHPALSRRGASIRCKHGALRQKNADRPCLSIGVSVINRFTQSPDRSRQKAENRKRCVEKFPARHKFFAEKRDRDFCFFHSAYCKRLREGFPHG